MFKFIWEILIGHKRCDHKWKVYKDYPWRSSRNNEFSTIVLQCEKCGDLKSYNVSKHTDD